MKPFLILLFTAAAALAQQLPNVLIVNGNIFDQVVYTRHDPARVYFRHNDGTASAAFSDLPKEVQEAFHYDPEAAKQFAAQQQQKAAAFQQSEKKTLEARANQAAYEEWKKTAVTIHGKVISVTAEGAIVHCWTHEGGKVEGLAFLHGLKDIYDDQVIRVRAGLVEPLYQYTTITGANKTIRQYLVVERWE